MPGKQFKLAMAIAVLATQSVAPVRGQNCDNVNAGRVGVVAGGLLAASAGSRTTTPAPPRTQLTPRTTPLRTPSVQVSTFCK